MSDSIVHIHADESCLGNQFRDRPRPGGAAGVVEYWRPLRPCVRRDYWISEPATTNNRMAIRSAIEPLRALRRPCEVVFVSDSQYLVKGMREWIQAWVRQGWQRKSGPVENAGLWQELLSEASRHRVDWRWVRGHAGHPQNEFANELAIRAARDQSASGGLIESAFGDWIAREQAEKGRYLDFVPRSPREGLGAQRP